MTVYAGQSPDAIHETNDMFDPGEFMRRAAASGAPILELGLDEVVPTRYNPERARIERYASLDTEAPPIVVVEKPEGYHVIDGHHRLEAAKIRGEGTISAYVLKKQP